MKQKLSPILKSTSVRFAITLLKKKSFIPTSLKASMAQVVNKGIDSSLESMEVKEALVELGYCIKKRY